MKWLVHLLQQIQSSSELSGLDNCDLLQHLSKLGIKHLVCVILSPLILMILCVLFHISVQMAQEEQLTYAPSRKMWGRYNCTGEQHASLVITVSIYALIGVAFGDSVNNTDSRYNYFALA